MRHAEEQPNPEPITATGKLIALSNDGRAVDFHATIEDRGEHITLTGITKIEAEALRPHVGRPVTLRVEGAGCPDWKAQHGHLLRMLGARDHADAGRCIAERDRMFMDLERTRDANESLDAKLTDAQRTLWVVLHEAGGAIIPRRELERLDWSRCRLHSFTDMRTGDLHLEATLSAEVWDIDEPPVAASRAELADALRKVADALGVPVEFDALDETVEAMLAAAANACCWATRQGELAITSALGCDDNLTAVMEAIKIARQGAAASVATAGALGALLKMLDANDPSEAADAIQALKRDAAPTFMGAVVPAEPYPGPGVAQILRERRRQIAVEGHTRNNDHVYQDNELTRAAFCYLLSSLGNTSAQTSPPGRWPWPREAWKPKNKRADLVRAGALIAAEIDRMDGCEDGPASFDGLPPSYAPKPDAPVLNNPHNGESRDPRDVASDPQRTLIHKAGAPLFAAVDDVVVEPPHTGTSPRLGDFPANSTPAGKPIPVMLDTGAVVTALPEYVEGEQVRGDRPVVTITVAGIVGVGKSAVALSILDALRAAGLSCEWAEEFSERNLGTGAEDIAALDVKPLVVIHERVEPAIKAHGFMVTGLTNEQLVEKAIQFGMAEQLRDLLLAKIGTPPGTVLVSGQHELVEPFRIARGVMQETMSDELRAANSADTAKRSYAIQWAEIDELGVVTVYRNSPHDWPEWLPRSLVGMTAEKDRGAAAHAAEFIPVTFDLVAHLVRQREWSERTFGPGERTAGVLDHIRKELAEVEAAPGDVFEWIDLVILAFDGAWRAGHDVAAIVGALQTKQARNESRTWPDWRTAEPGKAIEHVRGPGEGQGGAG